MFQIVIAISQEHRVVRPEDAARKEDQRVDRVRAGEKNRKKCQKVSMSSQQIQHLKHIEGKIRAMHHEHTNSPLHKPLRHLQ